MWYFLYGDKWISCSRAEAKEMYREGYAIKCAMSTGDGILFPKKKAA